MRQHGNESWYGHREITREAVRRLFAERAGHDGRIRGLAEQTYFEALDRAQAWHDRPLGAGIVHNFGGTSISLPYAGLGPTLHAAWANPGAQREHFMADPYRSGQENLRINTAYVFDELAAARRAGGKREMTHLGSATHALQDSYSGAHAWRHDLVYAGDPTAPVQSFHVFTLGYVLGLDRGRNTHEPRFDMPPRESGSTVAAVEATFRMLRAHEDGHRDTAERADLAMRQTLEPMFRASAAGVTANLAPDERWMAERDRRIGREQPTTATMPADEMSHLTEMMSGQPDHPLAGGSVNAQDADAGRPWQDRQRGPQARPQPGQRHP